MIKSFDWLLKISSSCFYSYRRLCRWSFVNFRRGAKMNYADYFEIAWKLLYRQIRGHPLPSVQRHVFYGFKFYGIFFYALVFYVMSFLCPNFLWKCFLWNVFLCDGSFYGFNAFYGVYYDRRNMFVSNLSLARFLSKRITSEFCFNFSQIEIKSFLSLIFFL